MVLPRRALRTRSRKRKKVRTPGGRLVIHYFDERPGAPRCGICGKLLHGIRVESPSKTSKSERTVSRIYGGNVCASCLRNALTNFAYDLWTAHEAQVSQ
ncbi:MAG: 60S ribosomal protein L34 [Thaumarchaeota archaeon]|nr:60S ribosomal protein L34 [Candidatus Terraquivivens yellowstonensis]MCL7397916.1 60S ribosomal protein L34 [Candidatus Terraquivivens yellowstonensis]MCL7400076.1 60S ribosomal protein L34 [Candidatus Terraquivivens yellowstonensis]